MLAEVRFEVAAVGRLCDRESPPKSLLPHSGQASVVGRIVHYLGLALADTLGTVDWDPAEKDSLEHRNGMIE